MSDRQGQIRIGTGGWTYEQWRGDFYPEDLTQKRELEFASRHMTSIEINGTYYGSQKPESFAKWHDETPEDFIFSLKAPRYATNRRVLAEAGATIERFITGGMMELKAKLGPINWQFMPTKTFNPTDVEAFLKMLPASHEGHRLRHALEVRHETFQNPDFLAMAQSYGVAIVVAGDADYPLIADPTAPFMYARIMGTVEKEPKGYSDAALDLWAARARAWAKGERAEGLALLAQAKHSSARDVYLYVISGYKQRNPQAAMALIDRLT